MTRLGQEHSDQPSRPRSQSPSRRFSHCATVACCLHSLFLIPLVVATMCAPQSPLCASCAWSYACCIPHCRTCRLETKSSTRIESGALCSVSNPDVTTCSDVTSVIVHPAGSVAPQRTSARLLEGSFRAFAHSQQQYEVLCFVHSPVDLAIILPPPQMLQGHAPPLGGRVFLQCPHLLPQRRPNPLISKSTVAVRRTSKSIVAWLLYQCSTTGSKQTTDCTPNKNTVKWSISVDDTHSFLSI